jgi:hypothetical protein
MLGDEKAGAIDLDVTILGEKPRPAVILATVAFRDKTCEPAQAKLTTEKIAD